MVTNKDKFNIFLEVAGKLNKYFKIRPILYGSLGLSLLIPENIKVNDIDILVSEEILDGEWSGLIKIMGDLGFKMVDEPEHQFVKEDYEVAFAKDNDLFKKAGIVVNDLNIVKEQGVIYKILSLKQYLKVYKNMLRDEYRQEKRGGADVKKINLIIKHLNNKRF